MDVPLHFESAARSCSAQLFRPVVAHDPAANTGGAALPEKKTIKLVEDLYFAAAYPRCSRDHCRYNNLALVNFLLLRIRLALLFL